MTLLIASILMHSGGGPLTGSEVKWFFLAFGAVMLVGACWDLIDSLIKRFYGRKWPTIQAVIDIVSVAYCEDDSPIPAPKASLDHPYYLATLTYIYNNPEQQMGDYKRRFGNEKDAKDWANSYKGETVKVHVDPHDPTRSVLREEDL